MANEKRLIDVNNALEELKKAEKEMHVVDFLGCKAVDIKAVIHFIERMPTVDAVEVVHGRWVDILSWKFGWKCSKCERMVESRENYCSHCGAKMDGGNEDG